MCGTVKQKNENSSSMVVVVVDIAVVEILTGLYV